MVEVPVKMYVQSLAKQAKQAARPFSHLPNQVRSRALTAIIEKLQDSEELLIESNRQDLDAISKDLEPGAYREALDRIRLTKEAIDDMIEDLKQLQEQPDPLGK